MPQSRHGVSRTGPLRTGCPSTWSMPSSPKRFELRMYPPALQAAHLNQAPHMSATRGRAPPTGAPSSRGGGRHPAEGHLRIKVLLMIFKSGNFGFPVEFFSGHPQGRQFFHLWQRWAGKLTGQSRRWHTPHAKTF